MGIIKNIGLFGKIMEISNHLKGSYVVLQGSLSLKLPESGKKIVRLQNMPV